MTVFAGVLYSLWIVFQKIFSFLLPFLIATLLFVIGRMYYRHKKYGYDYFDLFKKRKEINATKELTLNTISKLDPDLMVKEEEGSLIVMTSIGMICIFLFPFSHGSVEGNVEEKTLTFTEQESTKTIKNPFYMQDEKIKKWKKFVPVFGYVLFDTRTILSLKGKSESQAIRENQLYFKLDKLFKENPHYTKEEMETIFEKI